MRVVDLAEIRAALDPARAIDAVRAGFVAHARGNVQMGSVGHLAFAAAGGDCHIKSAALADGPFFVVKVASGFPRNVARGIPSNSGMMVLFDAAIGQPVCLLRDEGWLTDVRTAIAGVLAARLVRPTQARRLGIVGTGTQAGLQARWVSEYAGFSQVMIWGRNRQRALRLVAEVREYGIDATVADTATAVARFADVLVTTTPARSPVMDMSMFDAAPRIVAVGADTPGKQELTSDLTSAMDLIVADSIEQCLDHGEIAAAHREGMIDASRIRTLGELLLAQEANVVPGQAVLVDLTGLGVQDLQIATMIWESLGIER